MKIQYLAIAVIGLAFAFASCEQNAKISGTWSGTPEHFGQTGTADVSGTVAYSQIVSRLQFDPQDDKNQTGTIGITSDITIMDDIAPDSSVVNTYEASISATASIEGTYRFTSDDDIAVALDFNTLQVYVDPEAVTYNIDVLTQEQEPKLEAMRQSLARKYADRIKMMLRAEYAKYQKIDDIKVSHGIMSCEINDHDYTFRQVP